MNWIKLCFKHKLTIYLLALAISLFGLFCIFIIPITPFPLQPSKNIEIEFSYPGANAQTVQTQIIQKVSNALQSLNNIKDIRATAQANNAEIQLELNQFDTQSVLQTQIQIIQAISSSNLPSIVPQPIIHTSMSSSSLITFVITSDKWTLFQLDNFIRSTLYPKFSSIPGVALDAPDQQPEIKIKLYPEKLAHYQLSVRDIDQRINAMYHTNPLGVMQIKNQTYQLDFAKNIDSLYAFKNLVIGFQNTPLGEPIYLKDIADVTFEPRDISNNSLHNFNGHTAAAIDLFTHGVSNPFITSELTKNYVAHLKSHLPSWIKIYPINDEAKDVKSSIHEVLFTIFIATLLVLAIALIFLGHLRTTLIPIITVPICLLGAIAVISALGYSINLLTLLALVIAVGLVVDDAIVVVENITRHLEMGMKKQDAILHGTADIALTI